MANRLKKKNSTATRSAQLRVEKEEKLTVKEVVKDERTSKIGGALCLLFSLFLFFAFFSYLFTWQKDQDKIIQYGVKIFTTDDIKIANLLGVLGLYAAHTFIYKGFGIASFLLCPLFFTLGVNLLLKKKKFDVPRFAKYTIAGLFFISMTLAFFTRNSAFSWGGGVGEMIDGWFIRMIGNTGTALLLCLIAFAFIIWKFNPAFTRNKKNEANTLEGSINDWEEEEEIIALPEEDLYEEEIPLIEEPATSSNKLKKNDGGVVVIMPKQTEKKEDPLTNFSVVEKEIPLEVVVEPVVKKEEKEEEFQINIPENSTVIQVKEEIRKPEDDVDMEIINLVEDENEKIKDVVTNTHGDYEPTLDLSNYKYPGLDLLEAHGSDKIIHDPAELENNKNQIVTTLKNYDIAIQRISATIGPTVTLYEIVPAPGVRISRIKNLEDDIALSLAALGIRIIAPIPGKGTIGIEVPNVRKTIVSMKTLLSSEKFQNTSFSLPIAIGKRIDNENFIVDLASMPHLLMAGATGQGKSVGINTVLVSLLYRKHPSQLKFVLIDPKKVELSLYRVIENHFLAKLPGEEEAIITDTKKVIYTLNALCIEMDNRYDLLKDAGCRNIKEYNEKFIKRRLNPNKGHQFLPFIVLVVDEFADLIMTAGKEVEMPIARLAQLARAVGIHLIIATQRPSVNIITGTIKANFPARIGFKVSSKIDSRTILDTGGAEQLIGKGDMLISYNGEITRLQCAFVDTPEVERICDFIAAQQGYPQPFLLPEYVDEKEASGGVDLEMDDKDVLFNDAARLIVQHQIGSTSLIQRRMKLGYNRAGRLMDQLERAGIVGPNQGSKPREVYIKTEAELNEILDTL